MEHVYEFEEGHFESWDDFVQRMIYIVENCLIGREDWDFDDWTGGDSEFASKVCYIKGKEMFTNLKKEKLEVLRLNNMLFAKKQ